MSEEKEHKEEQKSSAEQEKGYQPPHFLELVLSVAAGALQALDLGISDKEGETGKPNLVLARYSIDLLELLNEKTKGNLEEEEERFLKEMLHQLRLKYVEVTEKFNEESK